MKYALYYCQIYRNTYCSHFHICQIFRRTQNLPPLNMPPLKRRVMGYGSYNPYTAEPYKKARKTNGKVVVPRRLRGYASTRGYYGRFAPMGTELKFRDTTASASSVSSTGIIHHPSLNLIIQSAGEEARVGRKCTLTSIHLKYVVTLPNTTGANNTDDGLRLIVYLDKQCNGASAAVTDILEDATYLSYNNLANKNRFQILMDRYHDVSATAGGIGATTADSSGEKAVTYQWHMRCRIPIEFSGATTAISEVRSNNVGVLAITDGGRMDLSSSARVRFADN